VIKVESLPNGDPARKVGIHFINGESAQFLIWDRGKRSLAVDLRDRRGIDCVKRLVSTADVFVESYRPGVADEMGLGYEDLRELNPRLVYCSVTAYGNRGPMAGDPGTDPVVQAVSGVMSVTGEVGGPPLLVGVPIADFSGAMVTMQAVLLGIIARDRTGEGQHVQVSMLAALLSALTTRYASFVATGEDPTRHGAAHSIVMPYQAFRTSDGYAVAGVWADDGWPRFCRAVGRVDLVDDPRFSTNVARVRNRRELTEILEAIMVQKTTAEWEQEFRAHRALFGPLNTFSQVFSHPQVEAMGIVQLLAHPIAGETPQIGPPIEMSLTPGRLTTPSPLLGQHTMEVLREAGLTEAEVDSLVSDGVVLNGAAEQAVAG
jgi:crotonobetainyl-CoA:carnitine CoA-transferase CaiB-like acyl-CoA transferase